MKTDFKAGTGKTKLLAAVGNIKWGWNIRHLNQLYFTYRIIPKISPGLIFGQSTFFLGLFSRGLIFGGAYFWDEIRVRKGGGLIIEGYISATITKTKRIISL